jgi:tetratricopeptide (TPR) repeat protein
MWEAIRLFREAINRDPDYAEAYAGLADALIILAEYDWAPASEVNAEAISAAERALTLNPSLAGAHTSLAGVRQAMRDWAGAEEHYRQALALDPDHAYARFWYSLLLDGLGRHDEALEQATLARELDPLSPAIDAALWSHYYVTRDFDRAIAEARELVRAHPEYPAAWVFLSDTYVGASRLQEARDAKERAQELSGGPIDMGLARILALEGDQEGALRELDRVQAWPGSDRINPILIATVYIALGDFDQAFRHLYRTRDQRSPVMEHLTFEFAYDPIRSDPRFIALMEELNLPIIEYQ